MSKYTPGPWRYTDGGIIDAIDVPSKEIADVYGADIHDNRGPDSIDEAIANARLIIAAPELLEAAKIILAATNATNDDPQGVSMVLIPGMDKLAAAIAKAEGEEGT